VHLAGRACLILALAVALYGIGASLYGARARRPEWVASGRRAVYALALLVLIAFGTLQAAFLRSDFSFALVASHSSTTTPPFYRATAMWSSQEGSLLLWLALLSVWSSIVLYLSRQRLREIAPYATAVLLGLAAFFCALLVLLESPFGRASPAPIEGIGLSPLLRHPSMMIHPPMLYSGYTLFTVPFAFAVGALVTRRNGPEWIRATRPFVLGAWMCLGTGIVLGARWSYSELGWGGYWAWDPVENASLMPWLTGTAFLHSAVIQEKRGMLKVWNVSLVLATGILAVLGTFLVRSGILDSIHAFGASTLGIPFVSLIGVMIAGSVLLVASRARGLRSEHRLDSLLSREAAFLVNNVVLVALCFVIFWGTFFPLISEALTGSRSAVGPPWFDRYTVPLVLILVLLSGIGPILAWRRTTAAAARRALGIPVVAAAAVLIASLVTGLTRRPAAAVMFCAAALVVTVVAQEYRRGVRARRAVSTVSVPAAVVQVVRRNRRRYGGYLVHAGVALLFVGVAASSAFRDTRDVRLTPGESVQLGGYEITYLRPTADIDVATNGRLEKLNLGADLRVRRGGQVRTLHTERSYFASSARGLGPVSRYFEGEATSEVGLDAGWRRDVWTVVMPDLSDLRPIIRRGDAVFRMTDGLPGAERAAALGETLRRLTARYRDHAPAPTLRLMISPLATWIWLGALLAMVGGVVAIWPGPSAARTRMPAPVTPTSDGEVSDLGHLPHPVG
jgi:cytochrome c-type biogenesis protein CcmF